MGLITNFLAIIIGGILGLTIGKKFNEDIKNIIDMGADAALVGEILMRAENKKFTGQVKG